ncbi:MAG: Glutamate-1-semialdehyde 2,1-aminomutase, partial [uncultured Nocardioides sp.]
CPTSCRLPAPCSRCSSARTWSRTSPAPPSRTPPPTPRSSTRCSTRGSTCRRRPTRRGSCLLLTTTEPSPPSSMPCPAQRSLPQRLEPH